MLQHLKLACVGIISLVKGSKVAQNVSAATQRVGFTIVISVSDEMFFRVAPRALFVYRTHLREQFASSMLATESTSPSLLGISTPVNFLLLSANDIVSRGAASQHARNPFASALAASAIVWEMHRGGNTSQAHDGMGWDGIDAGQGHGIRGSLMAIDHVCCRGVFTVVVGSDHTHANSTFV